MKFGKCAQKQTYLNNETLPKNKIALNGLKSVSNQK